MTNVYEKKVFAGTRLRSIRQSKGLTQREFAQLLGISASYLNQIENNQRSISASVILALMNNFGVEIAGLARAGVDRLGADLNEALADPLFKRDVPSRQEINAAVTNAPEFARSFLVLHHAYQSIREHIAQHNDESTGEPLHTAAQPYDEVRDYFHYHDNYFDDLDRAAEERAAKCGVDGSDNKRAAVEQLLSHHRISVTFEHDGLSPDEISRFDASSKCIRINAGLPIQSQAFHLWHRISELEDKPIIDAILSGARLHTPESIQIARIALNNFAAGATLMPYEKFLAAAQKRRHDIELLAADFGASLEQVAHRLSTLQRPGSPGVPFFFVRVDRAGTITKRHSATRLQFPRFSGACPLWNVHQAFEQPGEIFRQLAETPDGERYVSIARTITKHNAGFKTPIRRYAIALGSPISYVRSIIYADDLAFDEKDAYDRIGVSCRLCERNNCPQRSIPPLDRKILINPQNRRIVPFEID